jgi:hypothetical protein
MALVIQEGRRRVEDPGAEQTHGDHPVPHLGKEPILP